MLEMIEVLLHELRTLAFIVGKDGSDYATMETNRLQARLDTLEEGIKRVREDVGPCLENLET